MRKRTIREFEVATPPWPVVEAWAGERGFLRTASDERRRVYQRGRGWLMSPAILEIRHADGRVSLEAWIRNALFSRLVTLFILPAEIAVESGGMTAMVPRRIARVQLNDLLSRFGQPPIP
ncbi:MAG: hypothetical protein HY329_24550 [Chloroflexi bacterium]|nr:hypothetical protein [Chloroflexota bacterium]